MTDREVMQQALEALEYAITGNRRPEIIGPVITALRTALEQQAEPICPECKAAVLYECVACSSNNYPPQPQAEPVAWMDREGDLYKMPEIKNWAPPHVLLYTTPPQRPWVGLTDEEATKIWESTDDKDSWELLKRVEAKLKERNSENSNQ